MIEGSTPFYICQAINRPSNVAVQQVTTWLAWVSGVSGGKGERWKRKRDRAEGEKPSNSIPSNQNHMLSLGCQLHVSKSSHFQNEARCTTFLVKMSFISMRMKNDFQIKGWAPTFVLKQRPGGTRKWPINLQQYILVTLLHLLYYYMRNFSNLIGLEQWHFSLIWNTYMWKLQIFCG